MFDKIFNRFGSKNDQKFKEINDVNTAQPAQVSQDAQTRANVHDSSKAQSQDTAQRQDTAQGQETTQDQEVTQGQQKPTGNSEEPKADGGAVKSPYYNLIIVDESGSMSHLRQSTLSGINETLNTIRSAQQEFGDTQEHFVTLVTFDSGGAHRYDVRTLIDCEPIASVGEFNDYHPNGCTPLYDAMGNSIVKLENKIKGNANATALVTVMTDGLENASSEWDAKAVRQLIERLTEAGWSFSYMGSAHDVKSVADLLSIHNVMEFSHDSMGSANSWERERGSKMSFLRKMAIMEADALYQAKPLSREERIARKRQYAREYYGDRTTPAHITTLQSNEVFVFGSNPAGLHNGGAARLALEHFGAVMGQAEGMQGQSYAIPSTGASHIMEEAVMRFTRFAEAHPEKRFFVTAIGCGTAGRSPREVAPLFAGCIRLENVLLPAEFWDILGLNVNM